MKNKLLSLISLYVVCVVPASAATMAVNNLVSGPGDILYADSNNVPMFGGIVTMGYFAVGIMPTTITELQTALAASQYTLVTNASVGNTSFVFGSDVDGYATQSGITTVAGGSVLGGGELFGRPIYSIVADNSDLSLATEFALVQIGSFASDEPFEQSYTSNPAGGTVVIGSLSSIDLNPDPALPSGNGTYTTLVAVAVPEPSTALLSAFGVLALLRRKR